MWIKAGPPAEPLKEPARQGPRHDRESGVIKTILAPVLGGGSDASVLAAATIVARNFNSHIKAVHPRFDPAAVAEAAGVAHPKRGIADLIERLRAAADVREAGARKAAEEFCRRESVPFAAEGSPPPALYWRVVSNEPQPLAACAMATDLVVAARPDGGDQNSRWVFNALLFQSGRPVIIAPARPGAGLFAHVIIAWKATAQAARAVAFAMPFLTRAATVTVVTAVEDGTEPADLGGVVSYLHSHGIGAEARQLTPDEGSAAAGVLRAAADASLLVMGAYGHSRIGEWMFGGFTREVVSGAPVPVLMAH